MFDYTQCRSCDFALFCMAKKENHVLDIRKCGICNRSALVRVRLSDYDPTDISALKMRMFWLQKDVQAQPHCIANILWITCPECMRKERSR